MLLNAVKKYFEFSAMMADDVEEDVYENWEDFVDTGALDKKIEEMKSRSATQQSEEQESQLGCTDPVILQEDIPRTPYAPPQPQVKILKRPSSVTQSEGHSLMNGEKTSKQPIKTLQQREAEYAEARLRILGAAKNEEDIAEERLATITLAALADGPALPPPDSVDSPPTDYVQLLDVVQVVRPPRGPDGTRGFGDKR